MSKTPSTRTSRETPSKHERTYGQFCPIATGLDLVGDRWVLLICRELSMGDQRFTDLRNALPGIAPNLLSERLRALQDAGLVVSAELPPPAARSVYRLTAEGRRVIPLLRAVARFGAPYLEGEPSASFDGRRAALSLLAPWWRAAGTAAAAPLRYRLDVGPAGDHAPRAITLVDLVTDGSRLRVVPADLDHAADVVVTTTIDRLIAARRADGTLTAEVTGDADAVEAFYTTFDLRPTSP